MTIVQVSHYMPPHPGGIELIAETLFGAYRSAGFSVEWLASRVPHDAPRHEPGKHRISCLNMLETRFGLPVPLWGRQGLRELAAHIRRADVVHVHDCLYPTTVAALRYARRHGRPTLLTQHVGFVPYNAAALNAAQSLAYATLGRTALRRATRVVVETPSAAKLVTDLLGGMPPNFCHIPYGIDLNRFHVPGPEERSDARRQLSLDDNTPVVLFVGRLVEKKGLPLVLAAARQLKDIHFQIIGEGSLAKFMRQAPANVGWVRTVPQRDMTRYYHAADCLLLPSRGEGLPLVVQEVLACGLPAVVSEDEPYAQQLAEAQVVRPAPRDSRALAAVVRSVCESRADVAFRQRARQYAEQHWDVNSMSSRYVKLMAEFQ